MKSLINKLFTISRRTSGAAFLCGLISLLSATNAGALIVDLSDIANGSAKSVGSGSFSIFPPLGDGALTVSYNGAIVNPDFVTDIQSVYEFTLPVELSGSELTSSTLTLRIVGGEATRSIELLGYSGDGSFSVSDVADNQAAILVDTTVLDFTGGAANVTVVFDVNSFMQSLAQTNATHAGFLLRERPAPTDPVNPSFMRVRTGANPDAPALSIDFQPGLAIQIDIKPGSYPNSINLKSKGVTPIAILTTDVFNAMTVDSNTVCFGDADDPTGNGDCTEAHGKDHFDDVDDDGDLDMVLHFETKETGIEYGDEQACLIGMTFDGKDIEGCDDIAVK